MKIQETNKNLIIEQFLKAGIQYGHKSREWNPKMAPYILGEKNGIHIFNLVKTFKFLRLAGNILEKKASKGKQILFVGTSKVASESVAKYAKEGKIFYINFRWLGGMLTNWSTLQKRILKLKELENYYLNTDPQILSKKERSKNYKQLQKLKCLFEGIKTMPTLPDIVVFTSQIKESIAISECQALGIPTICVVDSNCNPDLIPYPIPGNDDAPAAIDLILSYLSKRILAGKQKLNNNLAKQA